MESHPVPQNVTTFEFHLVGDMTLRQFLFLATGLAGAYLVFIFFSKPFPLFAYPIIFLFAGTGAAFAFLPIMERPLDYWARAFFKAIFKPTQFKFKSKKFEDNPLLFNNRLEVYLDTINMPRPKYDATMSAQGAKFNNQPMSEKPTPVNVPNIPSDVQLKNEPAPTQPVEAIQIITLDESLDLVKRSQEVKDNILKTEGELNSIKTQAAQAGSDPRKFTQNFQDVLTDLQRLNKEAADISRQMANLNKTSTPVRPVTMPKIAQIISLTEIPNIINGIVTDAQGNYLEGAIVIAHDTGGLPVRALKTNKLGQFVAATPLPDGVYILTIEKENLLFDSIQIDLKEQLIKPLLIKAKKMGIES